MIKQIVKIAVLAIVVVVVGLVSYVRAEDSCCNYTVYCPYNWQCEKMEQIPPLATYFKVLERYNVQWCKAGGEFQTCSYDDTATCCEGKHYLPEPCVEENLVSTFAITVDVTDYDEMNVCCI